MVNELDGAFCTIQGLVNKLQYNQIMSSEALKTSMKMNETKTNLVERQLERSQKN